MDNNNDELRQQVGEEFGLSEGLAARLQGETREELEADASTIAGLTRPAAPVGGHDGGPRGIAWEPEPTMSDLIAAEAARVRRNRF
jgi:hypothetical protein